MGNHENRAHRVVEESAEFEGVISDADFQLDVTTPDVCLKETNNCRTDGTVPTYANLAIGLGTTNFYGSGRDCDRAGADVVSATTTTVGYDGSYFTLTGGVTVQGIKYLGFRVGSRIRIVCDGATVLKHNAAPGTDAAALFLKKAADYTPAANVVTEFVLAGGAYWREVILSF